MANDRDNLNLIQLCEIRATLEEHSALMKERFDHIDKRLETFTRSPSYVNVGNSEVTLFCCVAIAPRN